LAVLPVVVTDVKLGLTGPPLQFTSGQSIGSKDYPTSTSLRSIECSIQSRPLEEEYGGQPLKDQDEKQHGKLCRVASLTQVLAAASRYPKPLEFTLSTTKSSPTAKMASRILGPRKLRKSLN